MPGLLCSALFFKAPLCIVVAYNDAHTHRQHSVPLMTSSELIFWVTSILPSLLLLHEVRITCLLSGSSLGCSKQCAAHMYTLFQELIGEAWCGTSIVHQATNWIRARCVYTEAVNCWVCSAAGTAGGEMYHSMPFQARHPVVRMQIAEAALRSSLCTGN